MGIGHESDRAAVGGLCQRVVIEPKDCWKRVNVGVAKPPRFFFTAINGRTCFQAGLPISLVIFPYGQFRRTLHQGRQQSQHSWAVGQRHMRNSITWVSLDAFENSLVTEQNCWNLILHRYANTRMWWIPRSRFFHRMNTTEEEERTLLCSWLINLWANLQKFSLEESC